MCNGESTKRGLKLGGGLCLMLECASASLIQPWSAGDTPSGCLVPYIKGAIQLGPGSR